MLGAAIYETSRSAPYSGRWMVGTIKPYTWHESFAESIGLSNVVYVRWIINHHHHHHRGQTQLITHTEKN